MAISNVHDRGWRVHLGVAMLLLATGFSPVRSEDFPARTVKIVVPFPAGGSADAIPRIIGDWLSQKWRRPVVIENRPGAAGNIGAEVAFRAQPDGYTLLSAPPPPLVINQNLYQKLTFDPASFEKIIVLARIPNALLVSSKFGPTSVAELIDYAKANPGKINCAIAGYGTTSHLTSELFQMLAGVKVQHVPYPGSAPALNDLVAGTVDMMFDNLGVSHALVKDGRLRLLAVTSSSRATSLSAVPTVAETLPGFESDAFYAVVAPPQTPQQLVDKINKDMNEALRNSEVAQRLAALSAETVGGTPHQATAYLLAEVERWRELITAANVKLR